MHASFRELVVDGRAERIADRDLRSVFAAPVVPGRYGEEQRPRWGTIGLIVAAHLLLLFVLMKFDVVSVSRLKPPPLVVDLLPDTPPPPPAAAKPEPPRPVPVEIVVPKPVIPVPILTPAPVTVTDVPPPPKKVIAVVAAPPGPATINSPAVKPIDLITERISGELPRYPLESRRKREQGTVFLSVNLGKDGSVSQIKIAKSSGSARLDDAALSAVKRWRFSPTVPIDPTYIVPIPFNIAAT